LIKAPDTRAVTTARRDGRHNCPFVTARVSGA